MKRIIYCVLSIVLLSPLSAQVITTNRNAVGMEHNLLFNAPTRYTVTQTGNALFDINALFDGKFVPSYSYSHLSSSTPTVITIEGLPQWHTQVGAWIGWSTRYYHPTKFKIEAYDDWNANNNWVTVADYSSTPYSNQDFVIAMPPVEPTKLRFTFYESDNENGYVGLSELYYINPEACRPYEGLLKYDDSAVGTQSVGSDNSIINGYGTKLLFLGAADNSDPLWIARFNNGNDVSELRVNITDNLGQSADRFVVGTTTNDKGWQPLLSVNNDKTMMVDGKIVATEVEVKQNVWSDFVFKPSYKLQKLSDIESFVNSNGHLPGIPSEDEVKSKGVNVADMQNKLLQKIEELTLYVIQQQKEIEQLKKEIKK